ncbi:G kinase-anchoring protein 1 isoform X3 [Gymnodraco acuticeps]|uniref:G kinase-anchoring protein 1 isoform X3 n=1 Tax=Gymnodraco acuticeps TaxID=8218 RepID=A0A6P8WTG6_GYMAC|nr:G kinase-anchoring protein 1 isoform X3 [Gymnodraco acuticeps]
MAMITVPTTASRFALLQIDSDSDSDASDGGKTTNKSGRDSSGKPRQGKAGAGGKGAQCNDKKKDKKKKKKEQQQSEANELRNLAFKKLPQKSSAPPPSMTLSGIAGELLSPASGDKVALPEGWQQWKQKDEQSNNTNASSPKARVGKDGGGKKDKKKNQQAKDKKTVSLQDFQADGSAEHLNKKQEKEDASVANVVLGNGQEERFFNKVEDDVTRIVQQEKRRELFTSQGQEVITSTDHEPDPRAEQLKYDLEKKDEDIEKLKKNITQWEGKYKEVKARNSQLLKMLQQGEMKDKAELLLQVEELLHIKEELSSQVSSLHAALEQERSKVKGLQSDQPKHQNRRDKKQAVSQGNKRGRKGSEMDV